MTHDDITYRDRYGRLWYWTIFPASLSADGVATVVAATSEEDVCKFVDPDARRDVDGLRAASDAFYQQYPERSAAPRTDLPTMTVGQLRAALANIADDMPVIAHVEPLGYVNLCDMTPVGVDGNDGPAAILNLSNDYDTRQW